MPSGRPMPRPMPPGREDEDGDLKRRHQAGERVDAIAAAFGRKPGAIRSRLKKLGLV